MRVADHGSGTKSDESVSVCRLAPLLIVTKTAGKTKEIWFCVFDNFHLIHRNSFNSRPLLHFSNPPESQLLRKKSLYSHFYHSRMTQKSLKNHSKCRWNCIAPHDVDRWTLQRPTKALKLITRRIYQIKHKNTNTHTRGGQWEDGPFKVREVGWGRDFSI